MEELEKAIMKEIITDKYEEIIFDYLVNNCVQLTDEQIKNIVNLKCQQFESIYTENNQLKKKLQHRENMITKARKFIKDNPLYTKYYEYDYALNISQLVVNTYSSKKELLEILNIESEEF